MQKQEIKFEYGFSSVNGIVKKVYSLWEIPAIKEKCDVWNELPVLYVRQFTGEKDVNQKEIFENDIVKCQVICDNYCEKEPVYRIGYIKHSEYSFRLVDKNGEVRQWNDGNQYWYSLENTECLEVIGNIYENPELLNCNIYE